MSMRIGRCASAPSSPASRWPAINAHARHPCRPLGWRLPMPRRWDAYPGDLASGRRLRPRPRPQSGAQLLQQAGWRLHGLPPQDDELREHHRGPRCGAEARRDPSHLPRAGGGGRQRLQLCRDRLRPCRYRRPDRAARQRAGRHHRRRRHRRLHPGLRRQDAGPRDPALRQRRVPDPQRVSCAGRAEPGRTARGAEKGRLSEAHL